MTPREYFDGQPHGSIKLCSNKTGFSITFLSQVINGHRECSEFMAKVLADFSCGQITVNDCPIGPGKARPGNQNGRKKRPSHSS